MDSREFERVALGDVVSTPQIIREEGQGHIEGDVVKIEHHPHMGKVVVINFGRAYPLLRISAGEREQINSIVAPEDPVEA